MDEQYREMLGNMDEYGDRIRLVEMNDKTYTVFEVEQRRFMENDDPRPMYVEVPMDEELEIEGSGMKIPDSRGVEVVAQGYEEAVEKAEMAAEKGEGTLLSEAMDDLPGDLDIDQDDLDDMAEDYGE